MGQKKENREEEIWKDKAGKMNVKKVQIQQGTRVLMKCKSSRVMRTKRKKGRERLMKK